jgi:hypothetical protein
MPYIVPKPPNSFARKVVDAPDYEYTYKNGLDLTPGSDLHDNILSEVLQRGVTSYTTMSTRHSEWRRIDEVLRVFTRESFTPHAESMFTGDTDTRRKNGPKDKVSDDAKIIMPMTYATLETLLTYMTAAFIQDPMFKYEGEGPEDTVGAYLLERLIQKQVNKKRMGLALHTMWRDSFSYGIGVIGASWCKEKGVYYDRSPYGYDLGDQQIITDYSSEKRRGFIYEGNVLHNIDPYNYLPDPSVPAHDVQRGSYVGWVDEDNYISLLEREEYDKDIVNVRYLSHVDGGKLTSISTGNARSPIDSTADYSQFSRRIDVVHMYVNLIPNEWGLGSKQYPEKWYFAVAGDSVVICAKRMNLDHNKYPIVVAAPDYDGYSANPVSRLMLVNDMQSVVDFLYTSRLQNIRKSINDMIVVDPSLVDINDLNNPKPGKLIRMRRAAWGGGKIDAAIKQLEVRDVTQGHIQETTFLQQIMQQVTGANDLVQGIIAPRTSRISSAEAQGARSSALSRLEKAAKIISMQAMQPLGEMLAYHTQQMMSEEHFVQLTGTWEEKLRNDLGKPVRNGRTSVTMSDITVAFDVNIYDGSMPGSENIQSWVDIFTMIAQNPTITPMFNIDKIFTHLARQMGAKNIDDFVKTTEMGGAVQVVPDEVAMQQAQAGNITPMV